MNVLQPYMLWLLPLALLPIIIHLLNRLRYRTVKWAAIMFLIAANQSSTRHARIRHWLILASRALLLFCFLLALARPLTGGWVGARLAGKPDTILLLLDRSASMETSDLRSHTSRRERALDLFAAAARELGEGPRFVLLESVLRKPLELSGVDALADMSMAAATDTAADIPALLESALEYILRNPAGRSEIWLASDRQRSNWRPESERWAQWCTAITGLEREVRVRVISSEDKNLDRGDNRSLGLKTLDRRLNRGQPELALSLELARSSAREEKFPMIRNLNGRRSQIELAVDSPLLRLNRRIALAKGDTRSQGWGSFELPTDRNPRDNKVFFAYGQQVKLQAELLGSRPDTLNFLRMALAPDGQRREVSLHTPEEAAQLSLDEEALVVWQGGAWNPELAARMMEVARSGGTVLLLPPGTATEWEPFGVSWSAPQQAGKTQPYRISSWEEEDGPLARTASGISLPLAELEVYTRQQPTWKGEFSEHWKTLASYTDGSPFMASLSVGRGQVLLCGTQPDPRQSNLTDNGVVLVAMLQRMLAAGEARVSDVVLEEAGVWQPAADPSGILVWSSMDTETAKDPRWHAGVYRMGEKRVALNRPASEDRPEFVPRAEAQRLFGEIPVEFLSDPALVQGKGLSSEIWRSLVVLALLFMLLEAGLTLYDLAPRNAPTPGGISRPSNDDTGARA